MKVNPRTIDLSVAAAKRLGLSPMEQTAMIATGNSSQPKSFHDREAKRTMHNHDLLQKLVLPPEAPNA